MLVIVDYGVGNLASIKNMLKRIGVDALISSREEDLLEANKIILPGVGAFDTCATSLSESGLIKSLTSKATEQKIPVLGVCVGMQLLFEGSEEGTRSGLGWIKGKNVKFDLEKMPAGYKVPHMGWTDVKTLRHSKLCEGLENDSRFYFVHSYHAQLSNPDDGILSADYGYTFVSAVEHNNILGVQFHPEKSHRFGMRLFQNFVTNY